MQKDWHREFSVAFIQYVKQLLLHINYDIQATPFVNKKINADFQITIEYEL